MSERISLLTPDIADCPTVAINTAVDYVDIPSGVAAVTLRSGIPSMTKFRNGDCFTVLSVGYYIYERFVLLGPNSSAMAQSPVVMAKLWGSLATTGVDIPLEQFGAEGVTKIPFPNYECSFGVFIDPRTAIGNDDFYLKITLPFNQTGFDTVRVSMINVPAGLNGYNLKIIPFAKILHNFVLTA